ncbi:unnamed protein product [Ectocarpus sp. 13 AM-2016]
MDELQSSRAILAALRGLQDKVRRLENERTQAVEEVQTFKDELVQRGEDFKHAQELQNLTIQEESAASRLSYERLLAEKRLVDNRLEETKASGPKKGELKRELQKACETARDRGQDSHVAQLAAEAKASFLERRVNECEHIAQARKDRCSRARKTARRETAAADSQLISLARRVEKLQRTLNDERASRQSAESKHHQAKSTTIRISRYLDSILNVNQELVAAGTPSSKTPTARQPVPRALGELQRKQSISDSYATPRQNSALEGDGIDIRAAVNEALSVGRTGGDPVPSLTALYERIGFSAMQGDNSHHGGTPSLPTSPSRARVGNAAEAYRFRDVHDGEDYGRQRLVEPTAVGGFFAEDDTEVLESSRRQASGHQVDNRGSRPANGRKHHGTGNAFVGGGVTTKGYSFASSPLVRPTSAAERSPEVVKRLEALASQLERERSHVEDWYKDVVHRASPCVQEEGTDADLDARSLTEAIICCLQEKSQQLDVVRESLKAFKASPPTPAITSPTLCPRKIAALNVLQGLCHDVQAIAREDGGLCAA